MNHRFATALAAAGAWLLEPAEPARAPVLHAPAPPRPVVAVFGLAPGCGATVVARALAAELASRDATAPPPSTARSRAAGIPLATHAASRLARQLAEVHGAETRAVGRLCLVGGAEPGALADTARHFAPLVLDAGATSLGGVPAALADRVSWSSAVRRPNPPWRALPRTAWSGSGMSRSSFATEPVTPPSRAAGRPRAAGLPHGRAARSRRARAEGRTGPRDRPPWPTAAALRMAQTL